MQNTLKWAGRHCKQRLFESILIIFIIGLGTAALVSIFALITTMRADLDQHYDPSRRVFSVTSGISLDPVATAENPLVIKSSSNSRTDLINVTLTDLAAFKANLPSDAYVFVESYHQFSIPELPTEKLRMTGFSADAAPFYNYELASGSWFQQLDLTARNQVAVIGAELAKAIFPDENPLGQQLIITTSQEEQFSYEIIGIIKPTDRWLGAGEVNHTAFVPITTIPSYILNSEPTFNVFSVGVGMTQNLLTFYEQLRTQTELHFQGNAGIQGNLIRQFQEEREVIESYSMIAVYAGLGLIIAIINILNLMIGRVMRRQKGIGLSRALGASKRDVFVQILSESALLGIIGTASGIGLSFLVITIFDATTEVAMIFGFQAVLLGLSLGLAASILFGIYPAYRGTMVNPIDTLRDE